MLLESLVKATVELQGFRVVRVDGRRRRAGGRAGPRRAVRAALWAVRTAGPLPGHPVGPALSPCPAVGNPGHPGLRAAPRRMYAVSGGACRSAAVGGGPAEVHPRVVGNDRDLDAGTAVAAGGHAVRVCLGHGGARRRGGRGVRSRGTATSPA